MGSFDAREGRITNHQLGGFNFWYGFQAVGQGLFATGRLRFQTGDFNWVFDCGSRSRQAYLKRELVDFGSRMAGKSIGLLCLSHFDEDHVNGVIDLLSSGIKVDNLVMPYVPLAQRMLIVINAAAINEPYLRFLANPQGFMLETFGENIGRITLVAKDAQEGRERPQGTQIPPLDVDGPFMGLPEGQVPRFATDDLGDGSTAKHDNKVLVVGHGGVFPVAGAWEFLFFNASSPATRIAKVRTLVPRLLLKYRRNGTYDAAILLRRLKWIYARYLAKTSSAKNKISLVVYAGPARQSTPACLCLALFPADTSLAGHCHSFSLSPQPVSIVYFGDYPLTSATRLGEVRAHFGSTRWGQTQVVQMPHHGSGRSWHAKASAGFPSFYGVVSAARLSRNHPAASVLQDIAKHKCVAVFVNEEQRAMFHGWAL